jgi:multisubunit Na+/H+ antiporter MnhE subunit
MQPGSGQGDGGRRATVRVFVGWWIVLAALWLALAGKTDLAEICAAVVAGAIAAWAATATRGQRDVVPRPRARWVARLVAPLGTVPRDLWLLLRALARGLAGHPPSGELIEAPFDMADDAPGFARRLLAAAGGSVTPNTVVVAFDDDREVIVVHRLLPSGDRRAAADPMRLGEP